MSEEKIKILHVSPSFWPAISYGGPIFSTKSITDSLARSEKFDVEVITVDTADPYSNKTLDLQDRRVVLPEGYPVTYYRRSLGRSVSFGLLFNIFSKVRRVDIVHLTGPYNFPVIPTIFACKIMRKPLVWSTRGGFLATAQWKDSPKRTLKLMFEKICSSIIPENFVFHATADIEAKFNGVNFPGRKTVIIPNSVKMPDVDRGRVWRESGKLRLAFLSRVHPKKGLDILFEAMAGLPDNVVLYIYGAGSEDYMRNLEERVKELNLSDRVEFRGEVSGLEKYRAFTECDVFILPTHSENFGIVVAEALAHGTPVITTVNAPWSRIEEKNCGFWVEANPEELRSAVIKINNIDLSYLGSNGRKWMEEDYSEDGMAQKFYSLYDRINSKRLSGADE